MDETGARPAGGHPEVPARTEPASGADWLCRLAPDTRSTGPAPASSPRSLAETAARLGPGPVEWAVATGHRMARAITAEVPELGGGTEPFETLRMGTESSVLRALLLLADPVARPAVPDEALQGDRDFVRRGIPLDKVLRGIRLGHAEMARALMEACKNLTPPEQRAEHMQHVSGTLFRYIDDFSSRMTEEYLAEHDRWVTSSAAARQETVRSILTGEPVDTEAASRVLGYALPNEHLAVTAWCDPAGQAGSADLEQAAADFLQHHGRSTTLMVPTGRTTLWAWGSRTGKGTDTAGPAPSRPGIHLACGSPHPGPAGFRQSHQESLHAARIARLNPRESPAVVHYRDIAVVALMSNDLPAARNFVHQELGALADDSPQSEQLRETLRHYLLGERSLLTAAAHMHVARNTVTYRVKRAQHLLGHDLSERRFEVHAALAVAHVLGPAVLRTAGTVPPAPPVRTHHRPLRSAE
ncbi:PucR family transcriptional regulator [Kitasatospora sp. NPDC057223]|uniref:PucR family transcriptional regulator n=1 Tax=Kitasatospora sp. NPDC057223 TaxID=3346055 RepID=UPI003636AEB3